MTYRLMAEWATDLLAEKLSVNEPCTTHIKPLPGSNEPKNKPKKTARIVTVSYTHLTLPTISWG